MAYVVWGLISDLFSSIASCWITHCILYHLAAIMAAAIVYLIFIYAVFIVKSYFITDPNKDYNDLMVDVMSWGVPASMFAYMVSALLLWPGYGCDSYVVEVAAQEPHIELKIGSAIQLIQIIHSNILVHGPDDGRTIILVDLYNEIDEGIRTSQEEQ